MGCFSLKLKTNSMYPLRRNRRLRANASIRSLVRENSITPNDFLVPLFVVEGKGIKDEIPSMPNYFRFSLDTLQAEVKLDIELANNLGAKGIFINDGHDYGALPRATVPIEKVSISKTPNGPFHKMVLHRPLSCKTKKL